ARGRPAHGRASARAGCAAGAAPPGLLLRDTRPGTRRAGARRQSSTVPEERWRLGSEAAAGRAVGTAEGAPPLTELRRRARRLARGVRLFRIAQGRACAG